MKLNSMIIVYQINLYIKQSVVWEKNLKLTMGFFFIKKCPYLCSLQFEAFVPEERRKISSSDNRELTLFQHHRKSLYEEVIQYTLYSGRLLLNTLNKIGPHKVK